MGVAGIKQLPRPSKMKNTTPPPCHYLEISEDLSGFQWFYFTRAHVCASFQKRRKRAWCLKLQTHPLYCKISRKSQIETKCDFSTP